MLVSDGVLAGGTDAAGIEAAISSCAVCGTDLSAVAPIAGGSLGAGVLRPALDPDVALSGGARASGIDDGASPVVALLAGATLGVGSLGWTLALTGVAGADGVDGAVSFGAALVTGAGDFITGISISGSPEFTGAGAASAAGSGAASAAGGGPDGAKDFAAPFLAGSAACSAG